MSDTPYACNRETRTIYTNPILASKLTTFEKKFWILHEKGHINLNTDSEIKADNYAFDRMAGTEFRSLKQMIEALEKLLDSRKPGHQVRIDNLYRRAIEWDKQHPEKINKANANQINALGAQFNNAIMGLGTMMIQQTQTTGTATQSATNTGTISLLGIAFIAVIAVIILKK